MSDLSFSQGADPTAIYNDSSGNQLVVNSDGSINTNITSAPSAPPTAIGISSLVTANRVFGLALDINQTTAGTDNPLLLLKNPSGSGKTLYIYLMAFGTNVTNVSSEVILFANPTITTNGTSQTPVNQNIGDSTVSTMTAFSLPTISANGTRLRSYELGQNNNSVESISDFSIHLLANQNLLITGNPSSNNRGAVITIIWAEF